MMIHQGMKSVVLLAAVSLMPGCKNSGASSSSKDVEIATGEMHWEASPEQQQVEIKGPLSGNAITKTVSIETNLRQLEKIKTYSIQRVTKDISYQEMICPAVVVYGDGNGEWYNYWNLRDVSSKAAALQKAIKGVGPARANAIASWTDQAWTDKYGQKPRSWSQFKNWMNAIDDRFRNSNKYKELRGIAAVVTEQWGEDNKQSLGYSPRSKVDCHLETRTKTIETIEDRWDESFRLVSTVHKSAKVTTTVTGLNLLPGETEVITATFDGIQSSASVSSHHHQISTTGSDDANSTYSFQAVRTQTSAPNTVDIRISKSGNQLKVDAFDNSFDQLQPYKAAGTVSISLSIKKDGNFWIFSPTRNQNLSNLELTSKQGSQIFNLDGKFKSGENIYVEYAIKRLGTSFYDGNSWSNSKVSTTLTW